MLYLIRKDPIQYNIGELVHYYKPVFGQTSHIGVLEDYYIEEKIKIKKLS
jgi:hypothetical protein